jgi:hypothetical protein
MLASIPASMLNQNSPDLGILNRIDLMTSRFRAKSVLIDQNRRFNFLF